MNKHINKVSMCVRINNRDYKTACAAANAWVSSWSMKVKFAKSKAAGRTSLHGPWLTHEWAQKHNQNRKRMYRRVLPIFRKILT